MNQIDPQIPKSPQQQPPRPQQIHLLWPFLTGAFFLLLVLGIVVFGDSPSPAQYTIYRIIIALGGSGFAVALTGQLEVYFPLFQKGYVKAAAAFAVFVILYFFSPVTLTVDESKQEAQRQIELFRSPSGAAYAASTGLARTWEANHAKGLVRAVEVPTEDNLKALAEFTTEQLSSNGNAVLFADLIRAHRQLFKCVDDGRCSAEVVCSEMFVEIEGFRNLYCGELISRSEDLDSTIWKSYRNFVENTCKSDFLATYIVYENVEDLKNVCLPTQCWARNLTPPYPCQVRWQIVSGVLSPI